MTAGQSNSCVSRLACRCDHQQRSFSSLIASAHAARLATEKLAFPASLPPSPNKGSHLGGDALGDFPPTDMERFCSEFERLNNAHATLCAMEKWGLGQLQTIVMVYLFAHGQSWRGESSQQWADAAHIDKIMFKLAKKLRRLHGLPDGEEFIANLVPIDPKFASSLVALPKVLERYGVMLSLESAVERADKKLVKTRVLYLLFLAVKCAKSSKTSYQAQKSVAELLSPVVPAKANGEVITYKTVANRVSRFEKSHPDEAATAQAVVSKSGAKGVLRLARLVEFPQGFSQPED